MMGPMMGWNAGWGPALIVPVILLVTLAVAAVVMTRASRSAGPGSRPPSWRPGHTGVGDNRPSAVGGGRDEDPLIVLRERYARGEISHAEFVRDLDRVLRAEQSPDPARCEMPTAEMPTAEMPTAQPGEAS